MDTELDFKVKVMENAVRHEGAENMEKEILRIQQMDELQREVHLLRKTIIDDILTAESQSQLQNGL